MVQSILVVGTRHLDFTNDEGEEIKGTTVHYLLTDAPSDRSTSGFIPLKSFLSVQNAKGLKAVPGVYQGSFAVGMKDGKPTLSLKELEFVSEVTLG